MGVTVSGTTGVAPAGPDSDKGQYSYRPYEAGVIIGADGVVSGRGCLVTIPPEDTSGVPPSLPSSDRKTSPPEDPSYELRVTQCGLVDSTGPTVHGGQHVSPNSLVSHNKTRVCWVGGTFGGSLNPGTMVPRGSDSRHQLARVKGSILALMHFQSFLMGTHICTL